MVNNKLYRKPEEKNDITILDTNVDFRPGSVIPEDVRQTFTVKYSRPFKGSSIMDVNL